MNTGHKAFLFSLAAVFAWSTVATAFKLALNGMDYLHLLFFASSFSFVSLLLVLVVRGKFHILAKFSLRDYFYSAAYGLINPTLYYLVLFSAYSRLPAQVAQPLNYTWPVILVLLSSLFLGKKLTWINVLAILISFAGVFIISGRGDFSTFGHTNPAGIILGLLSALIWAVSWILNMKDRQDVNARLTATFFFGSIYACIVLMIFGGFTFPAPGYLAAASYVGVFEMGITFLIWALALRLAASPARISNLIYLSPLLSLVFIRSFLGEKILLSSFIGLLLIIFGIIIQQLYTPKTKLAGETK